MDWYLCFMPDKNVSTPQIEEEDAYLEYVDPDMTRPTITDPTNQPSSNCPYLKQVVVEYVLGDPKNIDPTFLDAIIYSFVEIKSDGTLFVPTQSFLRQMVNLKKSKPSLKVIAAIGGWGADGFSDAALTPTSRYNFAREINKLINEYGLDGIDIDWEYPGNIAAGITARDVDKENFPLLLTAIRDVIGDNKWLSVAGVGDNGSIAKSFDIPKIEPLIDYFNVMTYDFTAGESGERGKSHQANLFESDLSLSGYSADKWITNLENAGMPSNKILFGVPYYGRLGMNVTKSYDELRKNFINKNGYTYKFDNTAKVPYLVDDSGNYAMSFENDLSLYYKGQYVRQNCLGGIFAWTSTYDQANILSRAMNMSVSNSASLKAELEQVYGPF
ncbi:MAG: glycosyl hydrolase family 18 protein [Peptostreptococcaceae bacterium]